MLRVYVSGVKKAVNGRDTDVLTPEEVKQYTKDIRAAESKKFETWQNISVSVEGRD